MKIEERREGPAAVISPIGRLDAAGAPALEDKLSALAGRGVRCVVLDRHRVAYMSSAGLRALLVCARVCRKEGGRLVVAALTPECRSVVGMSGFLSIIDHHETRESAVAALA